MAGTRRSPLTPAEVEELARVYGETCSYQKAAEALGVDRSTARQALLRHGAVTEQHAAMHARACARGIRRARTRLAEVIQIGGKYVRLDQEIGVGLEPRDFASVANAIAKAADTLLAMDKHREQMREIAARTAKIQAEAELARARAKGEAPPEVTILTADEERIDKLMREKFGSTGVLYRHELGPSESDEPPRAQ